jgi:hypothetical protein
MGNRDPGRALAQQEHGQSSRMRRVALFRSSAVLCVCGLSQELEVGLAACGALLFRSLLAQQLHYVHEWVKSNLTEVRYYATYIQRVY